MMRKIPKGVLAGRSWLIVGLLISLSGCAANKRINTQQTEIDGLRRELRFLKDQNSQLQREMDDLQRRLESTELDIRQQKADLGSQMAEVSRQLEEVQNQLQETNARMTDLLRRSGSFGAPLPSTEPVSSSGDSSSAMQPTRAFGVDESREIYNTAYRDVLRGNYQLALQGFTQFIQMYPTSDLADNAQYWLGEVYYAQGRYNNAIEEFEKVIRLHRNSDKMPAAMLKIGYSYISINEAEQGKLYLDKVVEDFPDSQEANLAKGRLDSMTER